MGTTERNALIVGASRGIGLGLVERHLERGWSVVATIRERSDALEALACDRLRTFTLDMTLPAQIDALARALEGSVFERVFVNAGIGGPSGPAADAEDAVFSRLMLTNALAPLRVLERFGPMVPSGGVLAAMSSSVASIANNQTGGFEAYRASKAGLNMLLRSAAARDGDGKRLYLAVDPGWVKTAMGGDGAPLDVETSTRGIADMLDARQARAAASGKGGSAFVTHQDKELPW